MTKPDVEYRYSIWRVENGWILNEEAQEMRRPQDAIMVMGMLSRGEPPPQPPEMRNRTFVFSSYEELIKVLSMKLMEVEVEL